jgi:thiol-disulfide isomerase/thioredoxin
MEKWKVVVIILLIGMLGGYGFYQQTGGGQGGLDSSGKPASSANPQPSFVGKPMPAWNIPAKYWMNSAKPLSPADLKGSVTLLEFFRIDCPHCQEAAPIMEQIYAKYKPRGMKMLAIQAPGSDPKESDWVQVQAAIKSWGLEYPVAFDEKSKIYKGAFKGKSYPTVYLIDKQGIIRYQHSGHTDQKIQDLLSALDPLMK